MKALKKLEETVYNTLRRDRLSDYARYEHDCAEDYIDTISFVGGNLAKPEYWESNSLDLLDRVTHTLALDSLDFLHANYTAGDEVTNLSRFFSTVLQRWEQYAEVDIRFQQSDLHHGRIVAHASLLGDYGYFDALRLVCFAYLLGHTALMPRVKAILDYGNPKRDCLIERLLQPFGLAVDPLPSDSTRGIPYRNTVKIFDAAPEDRPALMKRYLERWYEASRREYYYDTHKGSAVFLGYWCFESGAITHLLDIDDSSYRDHEFYPKDMVDFARSHAPSMFGGVPQSSIRRNVPAGQPCPVAGWWFTPAKANSRRYFKQGETMPSVGGDRGHTYWQWDPDQSVPKL